MKDKIINLINQSDWTIIKDQDNIKMIQVQDGGCKINIYWGTMTIVTNWEIGDSEVQKDVSIADIRLLLGIKEHKGFLTKLKEFFI